MTPQILADNILTFGCAYGLALQALGRAMFTANLRPPRKKGWLRRIWGSKKTSGGAWGIDVGQCGLKALRIEEGDEGCIATAVEYREYPQILSEADAEADQLIRKALSQLLSRHSVEGDTVAIAVPGQSGLTRFIQLPPVEEKKVADAVKAEARRQIPFDLNEVVWDFQQADGEVSLFAIKRDIVEPYVRHFEEAEVEVDLVQMAPLAVCNFLAFDALGIGRLPREERQHDRVAALDIGTDFSTLVITDGRKLIWQRPMPLGGSHFTRAVAKALKLPFAEAERLKRNAARSGVEAMKKVLAALQPVLDDFAGEVQRSLGYFSNTNKGARVDYLLGLGNAFRLAGLERFLGERLRLPVRKLEAMNSLDASGAETA